MKVLIAYDGSDCSDAAVANLRRAGIPADATVLVISVVASSNLPAGAQPPTTELMEGRALVDTAGKWIQEQFSGWEISRQVLCGPPATVILEKVASWHPDLLVIGSHGRTLARRLILGSASLKLSHEAPCSVRVVRSGACTDRGPVRILVGCDSSSEAKTILQEVARRSWPEKSEVRIVSVVDTIAPVAYAMEPSAYAAEPTISVVQDSVQRQRTRFQEIVKESASVLQHAGLIVTAAEVEGDPKRDLVAEAVRSNADTIFVGASGSARLEEFLFGSVSTAVLTHAHCAVEVVRPRHDVQNVVVEASHG